MPDILQPLRGKLPSKRALLAIGGAAAVLVGGAIQTTDTLAAENDAVSANTSQIASQNFFPVLTPINPSYTNNGTACFGGTKPTLRWQAASGTPADQRWIMEEWSENAGYLMWTSGELTSTSRDTGLEPGGGKTHVFRIYGLNNTTKERSTGYVSIYVYTNGLAGCSNLPRGTSVEGPVNISTWQQTTDYTPFDAEETVNPQTFNRNRFNAPAEAQKPEPSTAAPSSETSAPSSEAPAPSTSESKPSTPSSSAPAESSTTESSTSATSTPESSTEKAPVKITAAAASAGEDSGVIVYHDGVEHCSAPKGKDDQVNVGNNEVTLTTPDGAIKKVDVDTCEIS